MISYKGALDLSSKTDKTNQENIFSSKTLTYFLQLAETMNYTQTAQLLGITQPALTQQIKKLEHTIEAPLFYSVGKKLHLTEAGHIMLRTTKEIYELLNQATDEIQQNSSATQGKISIGLLASIEDRVLERFAIEYYQTNPDIEISFHMLTRKEIWERLENNQIDLAVMYLPDDSIKNWKPYRSKKIFDEDLLFLDPDPKRANRKRIRYADTISQPWVMYPEKYYLNVFLKEAYRNQLVDPPHIAAEFTTPKQILDFAQATKLYTALPNSFVQAHELGKTFNPLPFEPALRFELSFVYRRDKEEIPRIAKFFAEFEQYMENLDYISRLKSNTPKNEV